MIADAVQQQAEIEELRAANRRMMLQLAKAKNKSEDLREAVYAAAKDALVAIGPAPAVKAPKADKRSGRAEVALLHMTDWQASKITPSYNSAVLRKRVGRYLAKVERITAVQRQAHPVREAVLVYGGDMIEGLFNYPAQLWEVDASLFAQWAETAELVAETVRWALANFEAVTVVPEWGNHGRVGSKRDHVPRSDNFDRMVYEHARRIVGTDGRLIWQDCPEDIQRLEVGNYRALVIHGDEIGRNGFASPMTIVQHVNRWRSGAYPWQFRDVYVGHYHTNAEWPMANGEGAVYQTGSTESENRYAGVMLAASATPSQRLHFIDPEKGRVTSQYKVLLEG